MNFHILFCIPYGIKKRITNFNLDKNQNKTIRKDDLSKIVLFHQPDYTDEFVVVIRSNEEKLKEINGSCAGLLHYTPHYTQQRMNSLQKFTEEIDTLISDLKRKFDLLNNDVGILKKYAGILYKFKINRQA